MNNINNVVLCGEVKNIRHSHIAHEKKYNTAEVETRRKSGVIDVIPIVMDESIRIQHKKARIMGQVRSRREDGKLKPYIYVTSIEDYLGVDENEVIIEGHVCSEPYSKTVRNGCLTQFLVCLDNNRRSYISSLVWEDASVVPGDKVVLIGRVQSRVFWRDDVKEEVVELSSKEMVTTKMTTD